MIEAGQNVLKARSDHPGETLANLYNPLFMHPDLLKAHEQLDRLVDIAFGSDKWLKADDNARLKVLFDSYTRMTSAD
ncbi:type IIL restriction-modification enzyme MmeI [Bifidobacterium callitrichidarum]|uniref:type IIL restriction-modification enzyme MmeI n=1 Tax=Bifidobacterium callitrichidarum TaxID=2052941 RepID=UPI0030C7C292